LPEGINQFPLKTKLVKSSWGKENYGGPCLPDKKRYYVFKLCVLDIFLELLPRVTKQQIEHFIKEYIIEKTELIGVYACSWRKE